MQTIYIYDPDSMIYALEARLKAYPEAKDYEVQFHLLGDDIEEAFLKYHPDIFVFFWNSHPEAPLFLSQYHQNPKICHIPMVVVYSQIDQSGLSLLDEYHVRERSSWSESSETNEIVNVCENVLDLLFKRTNQAIIRHYELRFFSYLHQNKLEKAAKFFEKGLKLSASKQERYMLQSVLYARKRSFGKARDAITDALRLDPESTRYLSFSGNILYRMGNYREAVKEFKKAVTKGPANFHHAFRLGLCYEHLGEITNALDTFRKLHESYPNQNRVNFKIINLIYGHATSLKSLQDCVNYVTNVTERDLIKLYRKMPEKDSPEFKRAFLDIIIREFSLRANDLIRNDDYVAALKMYLHVQKIVDESDYERQSNLNYCMARTHFKLDNFGRAAEHNDKAIKLSRNKHVKAIKLKQMLNNLERKKVG